MMKDVLEYSRKDLNRIDNVLVGIKPIKYHMIAVYL